MIDAEFFLEQLQERSFSARLRRALFVSDAVDQRRHRDAAAPLHQRGE